MSDTTKPEALKMKLSFKKETLRLIDDSQLDLLDNVVGGNGGKGEKGRCICLHGTGGCNTTGGDNRNGGWTHGS
jgi:hypothetical protein